MKKLIAAAVFGLAAFSLAAQDSSADFDTLAGGDPLETSDTGEAASLGKLTWSGTQDFAWRFAAVKDGTREGGSVESSMRAEYKLGDLKIVGAAMVSNNEFVPGEIFVRYAPGAFSFTAGWQEFSWGVADGTNPTDTLNARDYRLGANAPRLVNPAATAVWYPAEWLSFEAVYEPWKERSKFPKDFEATTQAGVAPLSIAVTAEDLKRDGRRPVYGGRASLFLGSVDVAFSYLNDYDTYFTPVVSGAQAGTELPETISLEIGRVQRLGVNAKTTIDQFGLWFEGVYNITEDPSATMVGVRDNSLAWVLGGDFNLGSGGAGYVNLQYAGLWIPTYDDSTKSDYAGDDLFSHAGDGAYFTEYFSRSLTQSLGSQSEGLLQTVTASIKAPMDSLTPTFTTALLFPSGYDDTEETHVVSALFKPELDVSPADGLHVVVGADLTYGWVKKAGSDKITLDQETDKLGVYTPQNNLWVKVSYQWNGSWGQ